MRDMEPDQPIRYRGAENLKVSQRDVKNLKVKYVQGIDSNELRVEYLEVRNRGVGNPKSET
jgi:hypothetical protein